MNPSAISPVRQLLLLAPPTVEEVEQAKRRVRQRRAQLRATNSVVRMLVDAAAGTTQMSIDFAALSKAVEKYINAETDLSPADLFADVDPDELHLWLMKMSLSCFEDGRAGEKQRQEVLDWILQPFPKDAETVEAFSFVACAHCGDADPEELQEILIRRYAPTLIALTESYLP